MSAATGAPAAAPSAAFLGLNLLGASLGWASGFLFIMLAGSDVPPMALAATRGLVAAFAIAALFVAQGRRPLLKGREWRDGAVLGALNGWGPNALVAYALTQISTASASIIQAASPLLVAVAAHVLFAEERLTARRFAGALIGFAGMAILIGPAAFGGASALGTVAMLTVAVSYAVGNLYVRTIPSADPARLALGQQIFSGTPALVLALAFLGPAAFAPVPEHALPLLALGTLGTAIPIFLFMRLIRRAGPTRAAMVGYLVPVWATLFAVIFLGETVGLREFIGGLVVFLGVFLVSTSGRLGWPRRWRI